MRTSNETQVQGQLLEEIFQQVKQNIQENDWRRQTMKFKQQSSSEHGHYKKTRNVSFQKFTTNMNTD